MFSISFHSWKGSKPAKIVYVDPPLLRKEMTVRERNQIFHEIPMDFLATKTSSVQVSCVSMDEPAEDNLLQWDDVGSSILKNKQNQKLVLKFLSFLRIKGNLSFLLVVFLLLSYRPCEKMSI